jgi:hypothetical protein
MISETVLRRVSKDISCASSYLSSKLIGDLECASVRPIVPLLAVTVLKSAIQLGSAIALSYTDVSWSNASGSGTCKANDISASNSKFTIINHSTDRQNILSLIKLDLNSVHEECKGYRLPGFEIGEFS